MKTIYTILILLVLTACNKEKRNERRLEGKWTTNTYASTYTEYNFSEDTYTWQKFYINGVEPSGNLNTGVYEISEDTLILYYDEDYNKVLLKQLKKKNMVWQELNPSQTLIKLTK